jgi:hypothetical protein
MWDISNVAGWVTSDRQRDQSDREASRLVGDRIVAVRYYDHDIGGDGWREVTAAEEWSDPPWSQPQCQCSTGA